MVGLSERFEMRLDEETIARVDQWRERVGGGASRAEAIRRLVDLGLSVTSRDEVHFSDGEKLLLLMMKDVLDHLGIRQAAVDAEFVSKAIYGGHFWAPTWRFSGVFHGHRDDTKNLSFVVDVLDMWTFLERGYGMLAAKDKKTVEKEAEAYGKQVRFPGFDGNGEAELIGIAAFLIEELERFTNFRGRDLNSHFPTVEAYSRMLDAYTPLRPGLIGRDLNAQEIAAILRARRPTK
ncbi:MAG: YfbU family protein [Armatimonadetes bacterium]|nr:YfbU family protein [Armatimonadota bacterium]